MPTHWNVSSCLYMKHWKVKNDQIDNVQRTYTNMTPCLLVQHVAMSTKPPSYLGVRQYLLHYRPGHQIWFQFHHNTPQKAPCDQSVHDIGHISSWVQHNHHRHTCVRKVWKALKPSYQNILHTPQSETRAIALVSRKDQTSFTASKIKYSIRYQ